jgi:hypothetical protein
MIGTDRPPGFVVGWEIPARRRKEKGALKEPHRRKPFSALQGEKGWDEVGPPTA